jgi:inward rectifier potassium channel
LLKRLSKNFKEDTDTGFGNSATTQGSRLVNKDGSFNVKRTGLPFTYKFNHFHHLITMPWWQFNLLIIGSYLFINLIFAGSYYLLGIQQLSGTIGESATEKFLEAFYFSCQTFSTVGYGRINPTGHWASMVASFESLAGLMSFALATGLLYGRFSRPQASLLYSEKAVVAPYKDISALMFRIANARKNQLVECEAQVILSINVMEKERLVRKFFPLKLEREKVTGLSMSWTIVHPIDKESPLNGWGQQDYRDAEAEFLFIFKAFDDTYSQQVHTRYSYHHQEIVWGVKFTPMYHPSPDGTGTILELDKIGLYEPADLPAGSNPTPLPERATSTG